MRVIRRIALILVAVVFIMAVATVGAKASNYGTTTEKHAQSVKLIYETFGHGYTGDCFVRIMDRESGGNPLAANWGDSHGGSFGLLQMNGAHRWRGESMLAFEHRMWNPQTHLLAAKRLYDGSGFSPWGGCP